MSTDFTKRSQKYSKDKSPLNSRPQKRPPVKTIPIVLRHALPCTRSVPFKAALCATKKSGHAPDFFNKSRKGPESIIPGPFWCGSPYRRSLSRAFLDWQGNALSIES